MQTQTILTFTQQASLERLRKELTQRLQRTVVVEYGATEDGLFYDAAFSIECLPVGSLGSPGPLVSILAGPGIGGEGYAVLTADGSALADGVSFSDAERAARFEAVREYRRLATGALKPPVVLPASSRRHGTSRKATPAL